MKIRVAMAGRKGAALALCAVLAMGSAAAIPAYAQEADRTAQPQAATTQDAAATDALTTTNAQSDDSQAVKSTTQTDLDNAAEGSTVELEGTITESLRVDKKLTLTAAEGAVMKADLTINANDVTVSGVHFTLDGTTGKANSIICNGKTGLTVKGCTLDITNGADVLNGQLSSVWLGNGANDATFDGNTFNTCLAGVDWSYVGINISGPSVKNTTVSNNTVSFGKTSSSDPGSVYFVMANGNSQTAGDYNVSGLKVSGNKISNNTGLASGKSKTLGIGVANASDVSIEGNTFDSLYLGVGAPTYPTQPSKTKSLELTNNTFAGCLAGMMMGMGDVEPGAVVSTGNDFGTTQLPYCGDALVWQSEDGHLYPGISDAVTANKTSLTLVTNLSLGSAANVNDDQDVTIDLNGHKLNGSLTNNGTLTIKDSAGLDGAVTSIMIEGTGKTTIMGGTYDSNPYDKDKGFFGKNPQVADGYGTLVRAGEDDGDYKYTVLPKDDVLASATVKIETKDGTLFFGTTDEANAYAKKNGLEESDIKPAKYTVSFDTNGNGSVDPITVESGESVTLPAVPEVAGYRDGAWYDGDQRVEGKFTPTSDVTLVAKWYKIDNSNWSGSDAGPNGSDSSEAGSDSSDAASTDNALPKTGDDSLAGVAALGAAGVVALGAGIVASRLRHEA